MQEKEQLVKMANQIADNFSLHDDAVDRLADHIQRFWAPSMRKMLMDLAQEEGAGLKPAVISAVANLRTG